MRQLGISWKLIATVAGVCRFSRRPGRGDRAKVPHRRCGPAGGCTAALAAVLAVVGVPGLSPSAALASTASVLTWTKQAPATSPSGRWAASMAYDAATGTVVLFGGGDINDNQAHPFNRALGGTWTWDGTTWTKQAIRAKASPPDRIYASMAYDAATGTVVLFGGYNGHELGGTWTWDGTKWTLQHPSIHPPARSGAMMAYDAATGTVVLFGGCCTKNRRLFDDTWTWDGTNWTQQHPASRPTARRLSQMAYDAATGTVVFFSNASYCACDEGWTWTWDGTNWTEQSETGKPQGRAEAAMAYDTATGTVIMYGGSSLGFPYHTLGDTWSWNGRAWHRQHAAVSPPGRRYGAAMAYDTATGNMVMFGGGSNRFKPLHDTWTLG